MTHPTGDRTMEHIQRELMTRRLRTIAARLHDLAESVARATDDLGDVPARGRPTYATVVARIQADLMWGVANLHLAELTTDAQQADEYRVKGE